MLLQITDHYLKLFVGLEPDLRTKDWFLVNNLGFTFFISVFYVVGSILGQKIMKSFKPFELRTPIMIYNTLMIAVNGLVFYMTAAGGWFTHYKFLCQPLGSIDDPNSYMMAKASHILFLSKFMELLDTVFFILRKRERQISFLHVYHHHTVILMFWSSTRYLPDGHCSLMAHINSFIHVIMYTYYLLSGFGPKMQKYLWWKKHLTQMQLSQFVIVILHDLWLLSSATCDYPHAMSYVATANLVFLIVLFTNFYVKNYREKSVNKQTIETEDDMWEPCLSSQSVKQD
ncbi:Hypothetical predicted protein [Cloeon dipterum]|uniref:Elongation of very long chain fatty acids protein n=1 Tax=Cloeon dipterum TaxID=197152 RepID=A0A8S1D7G6_9INSE|nr:Hypothetical predicted protein [Cloeon dipterum]